QCASHNLQSGALWANLQSAITLWSKPTATDMQYNGVRGTAQCCMGRVAPHLTSRRMVMANQFFSLLALCARWPGHPTQYAQLRQQAQALPDWDAIPTY